MLEQKHRELSETSALCSLEMSAKSGDTRTDKKRTAETARKLRRCEEHLNV